MNHLTILAASNIYIPNFTTKATKKNSYHIFLLIGIWSKILKFRYMLDSLEMPFRHEMKKPFTTRKAVVAFICKKSLIFYTVLLLSGTQSHCIFFLSKNIGLPWCYSGWESACQCREYGFDPWSWKTPHATE